VTNRLRKEEWDVRPVPFAVAQELVRKHHYARGGSNTRVYTHGLVNRATQECVGIAWWIPPTRAAGESVDKDRWRQVLALTRMVIKPGVPKNACSFLLAGSTRLIRRDGRFTSLVTWADEAHGHTGGVYRAANWEYAGKTKASSLWVDALGRQVARKATRSRTVAEMRAAGLRQLPPSCKHKFVMRLT